MQKQSPANLQQHTQPSPETERLTRLVRAVLNRRGNTPTESDAMRLIKTLSRLQPAALSALASSPSTDKEDVFLVTLQSLAL